MTKVRAHKRKGTRGVRQYVRGGPAYWARALEEERRLTRVSDAEALNQVLDAERREADAIARHEENLANLEAEAALRSDVMSIDAADREAIRRRRHADDKMFRDMERSQMDYDARWS